MDSRKLVFQETVVVALGEILCTALMIGIFALLGKYDLSVLLGGIAGCVISIANFFFMAVVVSLATEKATHQDPEAGKKLIKGSYPVRFLILAVVLFACAKIKIFNVIALVLPLVFVRPVLTIAEFFKKKEG